MSTLEARRLTRSSAVAQPVTESQPRYGWLVAAMALMLLVSLIVFFILVLKNSEKFPVNHVDVLGTLDFADRAALTAVVQSHTRKGFYRLNIDELRADVEDFEWVNYARISRVWPSRITVEVEEHEPAARWNSDSLISKRLVVFKPPQLQPGSDNYQEWQRVFQALPLLRGTPGRQSALLDDYRVYEQLIADRGLKLMRLDEDDRRSQTLELSNKLIVRLGYEQHALRLDRFLDVYPRLSENNEQVAAVALSFDMRYSNGFALGRLRDRVADKEPTMVNTISKRWK